MKKICLFSLVLLLGVVLLLGCTPAAAPTPTPTSSPTSTPTATKVPEVRLDLLATTAGTGTYTNGLAVASIAAKNHPWLRLTSSETPGFIYNVEFLEKYPSEWGKTIIGCNPETVALASKGLAPFKSTILGTRYLVNFSYVSYFLATTNPNIKTLADLAGKKVGLGYLSQIDLGAIPQFLLEAAGVLDKVNVQYVGMDPAINAVIDGQMDAAITGADGNPLTKTWIPKSSLTNLVGTGKQVYIIPWGADAINSVIKSKNMPILIEKLPAGFIPGMTQELNGTFSGVAAWAAKDVFPEDLAYEFTKLFLDNYQKFGDYYALGKTYSKEFLTLGLPLKEIHPGSMRAFKEAGVIK